MITLVHKFGGTSLQDKQSLGRVAKIIKKYYQNSYRIVVVVSAMGYETDRLSSLCYSMNPDPDPVAMDMVLSSGENCFGWGIIYTLKK